MTPFSTAIRKGPEEIRSSGAAHASGQPRPVRQNQGECNHVWRSAGGPTDPPPAGGKVKTPPGFTPFGLLVNLQCPEVHRLFYFQQIFIVKEIHNLPLCQSVKLSRTCWTRLDFWSLTAKPVEWKHFNGKFGPSAVCILRRHDAYFKQRGLGYRSWGWLCSPPLTPTRIGCSRCFKNCRQQNQFPESKEMKEVLVGRRATDTPNLFQSSSV